MSIRRILAKAIAESMRNEPGRWTVGMHHADLDQLEVWTANGVWFVSVWRPNVIHFNIFDKIKIWLAYRSLRRVRPIPEPDAALRLFSPS